MAQIAVKVVFSIGKILWRRRKRLQRKRKFYALTSAYMSGESKRWSGVAKNGMPKLDIRRRVTLNRFGEVARAMDQAVAESLEVAADAAVRSAKRRAPRDTGALRDSISRTQVQNTGRGRQVTIYTDVSYAKYVEFGAAFSAAHPYLRPAARAGSKRIAREVKKRAPK